MTTGVLPITGSVGDLAPMVQMDPNSGHVIVVLGMHRSGTSATARALQALGVSLGDNLYPAAVHNPTGFWQDRYFIQINEELLGHLGSAYDRPGLGWKISWSDPVINDLSVRAAEVLKQRLLLGGGVWAFKDPRTCRLLEFWCPIMAVAGYATSFVLAIRNPASVVRSLEQRDQIPAEKGYLLWLQHVIPTVVLSAGSPRRVVVDYDLLMDKPLVVLRQMAMVLGLPVDFSDPAITDFERHFLDESLRHTLFSVNDLARDARKPQQVAKIYNLLLDVAKNRISIDSADIQRHFSDVYNLLADLTPAFRYANALEVELRSLRSAITDKAEQLADAEQVTQLNEKHAAEQRVRAETAEQHAAEQRVRAETAE